MTGAVPMPRNMTVEHDTRPCRYCRGLRADLVGKSDGWLDEDLARGHRWEQKPELTKVYHCYAAYCD